MALQGRTEEYSFNKLKRKVIWFPGALLSKSIIKVSLNTLDTTKNLQALRKNSVVKKCQDTSHYISI